MNKLLVILFLFSVFLINFLPVKDTDFGWHYRCGKENCTKNHFSYFLPDYPAANPSFLYDKTLAFIYDRFGFVGVSVFGGLIMTLAAYFFLLITDNESSITFLFFCLVLFLSWPVFNLGLRSQIITYLFFLLSIFLVKKSKKNFRWLWLFPAMMLVWVNTHIGFFVGLIILAIFLASKYMLSLYDRATKVREMLFPTMVLLLSVLATLINPFGINVYRTIIDHITSPMSLMIAEWTRPSLLQQLIIIGLTITFFIVIARKKIFPLFDILMLLFFALLALIGVRNLPFFYAVFFIVISNQVDHDRDQLGNFLLPIMMTLAIFFAIINVPATVAFDQSFNIYCTQGLSHYPCQAIKNYPVLSGNVYAAYEWGGFLIWQKPQIKVYADGRMPAWRDENGRSPYQDYLDIIQTQPGWNEQLRKLKTDYLLIMPGTFLDLLLQKDSKTYGWQEKYRDDVAVIYKNIL